MQADLTSAFARLDLADPVALFEQTPVGVDGAAIRRAIETGLERVPDAGTLSAEALRRRVLAQAGQVLLEKTDTLASTIYVTKVAAPDLSDDAALAHVRLVALFRLGDTETLLAEADRLMSLDRYSPSERQTLRTSLRNWNIERYLPTRIEHLADYWPDAKAALADPFGSLRADGPFPLADKVAGWVAANTGKDDDAQSMIDRIRFGARIPRAMSYARRMAEQISQTPGAERSAAEQGLMAIHAVMNSRISPLDDTALRAHLEAGRSAVVTLAYAGLTSVHQMGLPLADYPFTIVSNSSLKPNRPNDLHVNADAKNAAKDMTQLGKLMKKSPRVVRFMPEVAQGGTMNVTVCGQQVKIGRGAAALAFSGGAATFFCQSHWAGTGFEFKLIPGPVATDFTRKESFENAFATFYANCLEGIVLGAPEDMAPEGAFWMNLTA